MKFKGILIVLALFVGVSCSKQESNEEEFGSANSEIPILGQWFLVAIGDTDVSNIECYRESYLRATQSELTFFIQDRQQDGSCVTVLRETLAYTMEEDFYYIEDEALEIYIEGNVLSWRVDFETTLTFEKN